jgi:uncharacterized protein YijF (DUF1287 family)
MRRRRVSHRVPRPRLATRVLAFVAVVAFAAPLAAQDRPPSLAAPAAVTADRTDPGPRAAKIVAAAYDQVGITLTYDPAYVTLDYPGGDVPRERGVCSDVVIRALRAAGIDLQKRVHEDMRAYFAAYPQLWGLARPDRNIDHRRVPNLERWFERAGYDVPAGQGWRPGDIVSWRLTNGLAHIGLVADRRGPDGNWLIVHNIGAGARVEAPSPDWLPVGHYRLPADAAAAGRAGR